MSIHHLQVTQTGLFGHPEAAHLSVCASGDEPTCNITAQWSQVDIGRLGGAAQIDQGG